MDELTKFEALECWKGAYLITTNIIEPEDVKPLMDPPMGSKRDAIWGFGDMFVLKDDDGIPYFVGVCLHDGGEEMFNPLDSIGSEYGCTIIEYMNTKTIQMESV